MQRIGIDAGGTLIKIAYEESGRIHVKSYPNEQIKELIQWLQLTSPDAHLFLTGGKRGQLMELLTSRVTAVDEFPALVKGTRFLLEREKIEPNFILTSIGTGTSIFHVSETSFERLLGSGIGGGTWMGLGKLITGVDHFQQLTEMAARGNHENSDLLVRDIYAPDQPPIDGKLTAANFGKAHYETAQDVSDHMAALAQLIGETLLQLSGQAAEAKQVKTIVFIGGTLNGNEKLKHVLASFQDRLPYKPVLLDRGAYAGAIGALL